MSTEILKKIKLAYITPFSIVINFLILFFYIVPFFVADKDEPLPLYIIIFIAFWLMCVVVSLIQEKRHSKVKISKISVIRYLIVDILSAYVMPLALSTIYVFASELMSINAFNIWLSLLVCTFISWLGMHMFLFSEFQIGVLFKKSIFKLLGILLMIVGFIYIAYLGFHVPIYDEDSNKFIWLSLIVIIASHAFMIRPYFNLGLFFESLSIGSEKENWN
ncbi:MULTISPECIES: DUF5079 family protein [Staphylococcaceae]|uniref:DUF5079 family protein n=2 Tax=Bacillales TaxID=1385 RepID=UPI000D1A7D76|nr:MULTISPECIES: DUF5079 family protein [Staphylococcaceae]PTG48923.1 hypothetical protein BUY26_05000 [Staphylococcus cohnii]MBW0767850.1 DUF5079 family protein [Mammaliicoccus lentus]MDQ7143144.1 DUF5079 family protein [Mammaliicoccus lentus]PTH22114.1 hypothetical protein BU605_13095 [Staphylococcus arlettae]PTH50595.1 hypothetical protein BU597_12405 [Staphylococcus arlettae]